MSNAYPDLEYLPEGEREKAERARDCLNGLCADESPMTPNEIERELKPDQLVAELNALWEDAPEDDAAIISDAIARISALEAKLEEALMPMSKAPCDGTVIEFRDAKGMYLGMGYWKNARWHRVGCRSSVFAFTEVLAQAQYFTISPARTALKGDDNE